MFRVKKEIIPRFMKGNDLNNEGDVVRRGLLRKR